MSRDLKKKIRAIALFPSIFKIQTHFLWKIKKVHIYIYTEQESKMF